MYKFKSTIVTKKMFYSGARQSWRNDDMRLTQRRRGVAACEVNPKLRIKIKSEYVEVKESGVRDRRL